MGLYIAGETGQPPLGTISLIESIVQNQVIQMISRAGEFAMRRGVRAFSNDDLIFQFRHDRARIERLQKFLLLKKMRSISRDEENDEKDQVGEATADALVQDPGVANVPATRIPWDLNSIYAVQPPDAPGEIDASASEEQAVASNLQKLQAADKKTLAMSVEEYATWSEYRHASFTKRRARFRQWCGLGLIADHRSSDDVLDILTFLTSEMVQRLTLLARGTRELELTHATAVSPAAGDVRIKDCGEYDSPFKSTCSEKLIAELDVRHIRRAYEITQIRGTTQRSFYRRGLQLI
ncbi:uncharacterized protein LMH87_008405 [Akanthomyces muscarius]|uniref:Uncharacterized protein n=1 Tax=Akanthomyces muscarius TaxID=2231603 RepID=A0A9W8QL40_AKAMU|nr:uncharacterized protein LMH87_008405 [Akanthomyces muscarius]KAJ4159507.1 hypothetical protein LMH87_008405 [Akanthomyces muscarius]